MRMNSVSKVIKVVSLKRFMPDTVLETIPKVKRPCYGILNPESSQIRNQTDEKTHTINDTVQHIDKVNIQSKAYCPGNQEQVLERKSRSKIKFRYCSHSPEELSTLHELVDDSLVKLGDTFESRDSLRRHLNDNARTWHYYYVCRNSKKSILEYNCICMAYNNKQRDVVIRQQRKRTTACPCKLRLTVDAVTNKMVVYYVCNHHDHPTTASAFSRYPHSKYLPQDIKEEFLDLTFLGLDVTLIQKYIFSVIGLKIKKKDIWSYTYRFKRNIFQRTFSDQRRKYIENLMKTIRDTFGEPDDQDFTDIIEKPNNTVIGSMAASKDINPNEDSLYKEEGPGDHTLCIDSDVIVQYINEEGLLCDQNGFPVANSSNIIQVINNYAYVRPESNAKDKFLEGTIVGKFVENIHEEIYWESVRNQSVNEGRVIYENVSNVDESPDSNDRIDEQFSIQKECPEEDNSVAEISACVYEKRLSPTPVTPAVYPEMKIFKKYYYVDHRYITYEDQKHENPNAIHEDKVHHGASNLSSDVIREEYIKAPNFAYWPPPLRHCSGHDHLDLLSDPDVILRGAKFLTHEVFLKYVNERANRWFFYYSLVESGKSPENYAYKCVYGKHRVSKNAYRAKGLRKRNNLKTDCPCHIRLRRLESDPAYLTVLYSCNHHDHPRDERQFNTQVHSRRLPPHMKEEIKDLVMLRVSSDVLRKYVLDETGLNIGGKYFYNIWAGMRRRNEERAFSEERLVFLNEKIKDLGARYGKGQTKIRKDLSQDEQEDRLTHGDLDETGTRIEEYRGLTDFAEEVYIVHSDTQPVENTETQSRLETRLQNLSHNEILMKVKKLQESVRCEGLRSNEVILE